MPRRPQILLFALVTVLACSIDVGRVRAAAPSPPNVIVILADDFGYECIGADGSTSYHTPAIDKLAAGGVRFDYCFAQPLCTPTRVQLLTGIYNVRNYVRFGLLDPRQTTFANLFQRAGYATCAVGKWQLGKDMSLPKHFGFDEYCLWQLTRPSERYKNPSLQINGREMDYTQGEYGPDLVNDYALDFIERVKDRRFLLYYPMILTHEPYDPTPESSDWNEPKPPGKGKSKDWEKNQRHFAEMTAHMDTLIGKLVAKLEACGVRDNTLILFTGDNGTGQGIRSRVGDREIAGGKGKSNDAGMRVPLVVYWPARAPAGRALRDLVDMTDFMPTICEAAGIPVPSDLAIDGRSFLPQALGQPAHPREWIYSWFARNGGATATTELARNHEFSLHRDGTMFDVRGGDEHTLALDVKNLSPDAEKARRLLQGVLDRYANARPADLAAQAGKPGSNE